jgi:hypothetical protein
MTARRESVKWWPIATIQKYSPEDVRELTEHLGYEPKAEDFARLNVDPKSVLEVEGNQLVTGGLNRLGDLFIADGSAGFNASQGVVGVGNSTATFNPSHTALQGTAWYQPVDGAPTSVDGVITAVSTFASGNANFAWEEWCWVIATGTVSGGTSTFSSIGSTSELMINRKVASMGTKASGASWVFTTTVTLQ